MTLPDPPEGFYERLSDPISSFRILQIHPAENLHEPLKCTLEIATRGDCPAYASLSYVWGSVSNYKIVDINEFQVAITENCELALRHVRKKEEVISIWVDAICINQIDAAEKSAQIGQMRAIYQSAAEVIVWLGEESEDTPLAFDLLTRMSESNVHDAETAEPTSIGPPEAWKAVESLFKREWFGRIWVVQEVAMANAVTVHCGHQCMSWTVFNRALEWYYRSIRYKIKDSKSLLMNAVQMRNTWAAFHFENDSALDLQYLLSAYSSWKATVLLDKVNALLGMSKEHDVPELQPDYTKSVREVYTNVVKYFITRDRRLDILGQCQNPAEYKGLPTWVPDWSPDHLYRHQISEGYRPEGDGQIMMATNGAIMIPASNYVPRAGYGSWQQSSPVREEMNFRAALDFLAESYFPTADDADPPQFICPRGPQVDFEDVMRLTGIEVDTIHSVTKPLFRPKEDPTDPTFFLDWEEFAVLHMPPTAECPYGNSLEGRLDAFWRTIITDRVYQERSNIRVPSRSQSLFEQWRANLIQLADPADAHVPESEATMNPDDLGSQARLMYQNLAKLRVDPNAAESSEDPIYLAFQSWKQRIAMREHPNTPATTRHPNSLPEELTLAGFERSLRLWCFARKLARTESGRLALVDEHVRPGDKVFVLYGGSVPYIVRPLKNRFKLVAIHRDEREPLNPFLMQIEAQPLHHFVGEAYVHGIMDGEAMEYPKFERPLRRRRVEVTVGNTEVAARLGAQNGRLTVWKDVRDPLTEEQELLQAGWMEKVKKREQEVWFDGTTPAML